ncbi:hypothetical protein MKQ68_08650 [Chitinophaga horti]|uniref:Glycine zipper family protein n=1 Tax=Chitinophaga horti TaxID=2920382 RepID=A0ABY6J658_9BACT|nr:hypothetical protein [Chitinophaga horti]UYQ95165.1 hypothetical protein MKQ68_08650 [Chitinophaga horti]
MAQKRGDSRARLNIAAGVCILIGLVIGFGIKRMHIGLMIGLALGLLSGGLLSKRK